VLPLIFLVGDEDLQAHRNFLANHYCIQAFPASEIAVFQAADKRRPALFLIDADLELSLRLCQSIRRYPRTSQIPVLLVAKNDSEEDRIRGFELGIDDFLAKPLRPREVAARINSLIRRCNYKTFAPSVEIGTVKVDTERFVLSVQGRHVDATATQVRLIEYLMRNPGRVFSRDQILDAVWSDTRFVTPRTIDVHIRRIRELIEPDPSQPIYLKTVRGAGYCFNPQDEPSPSSTPQKPLWFPAANERRGLAFVPAPVPARLPDVS
jgi:two-component system phosphate regulon response regulator PhoB